jgi:acetyl-CoA carboxylase alpha subunit
VETAIARHLSALKALSVEELVRQRYQKFRGIGLLE